jgi:50S ribosomal protein L16 3-hydroxylase
MVILQTFDPGQFLSQYWQRKPVLIKQLFPRFKDPVDEHDLAGLAEFPEVDSRLVVRDGDQWELHQGPFEDINQLCVSSWSLLVQGVDYYNQSCSDIMDAFGFIPHWRMDDLMVSYSVAGGGVGAHFDQYDVFIIQGKGQRRWQVGDRVVGQDALYPHPKLQQVPDFIPIIDEVLAPGDVLYIPPNFPHKGETISDCMNYSVGFRAPDQSDLFQAIADDILEKDKLTKRFTDRNRAFTDCPGAVSAHDIMLLKQMLQQYVTSPQIDQILTEHMSKQHANLDELTLETPISTGQMLALINQGVTVRRTTGVRPVYLDNQVSEEFIFYINGHRFSVAATQRYLMTQVLDQSLSVINRDLDIDHEWIETLREILNLGYYEIVDPKAERDH